MSRVAFTVVYDGPALAEHGMEVADLAPSLMALGELVKEANYYLNKDAAKVNLVVQSNFEHKCFLVNLEIGQTLYSAIHSILADDRVKTAKEIGEWLGLLGLPPAGIFGLFQYLRRRRGRVVKEVATIEWGDQRGLVAVSFEGDSNEVIVNNNVYLLGEQSAIRGAAASFVAPLRKEGIDEIRMEHEGEDAPIINKEDAAAIELDFRELNKKVEEEYDPQPITAHIQVSRPDFSPQAKVWKFIYGGRVVSIDISESNIAEQVQSRGYVSLTDTWLVRMTATERKTAGGQYRIHYKVIEVLDFIEGARQTRFPWGEPDIDDLP